MEKLNTYPLYFIGKWAGRFAASLMEGATKRDLLDPASYVETAIELYFLRGSSFQLKGGARAADELKKRLEELSTDTRLGVEEELPNYQVENLKKSLERFETTLSFELPEQNLYIVPQRRGWDMTTLIEEADKDLSDAVRNALTVEERHDVRESGRCLAFDAPTAAVFHMFRALEAMVLRYMPALNITLKDSDRNLGKYISFMEQKGVDEKITLLLRHIKDEYRNPGVHPGTFYDLDQAANQIKLAQSVMDLMVRDLTQRGAITVTAPLARLS